MPRKRKSGSQMNEDAKERRQMRVMKPAEVDDRPFWEIWWDMCCCSEAYRRRQVIEKLKGGFICDSKEAVRYEKLVQQDKKIVLKEDLPEGSVLLKLDEPPRKPPDEDRIQYRVDTNGEIIEVFFG